MLEIAATQLNECTNLEDYKKALRKYLNAGAKAMIEWRDGFYKSDDETQYEPDYVWTAVLQISDPENPEESIDLSVFFDCLKGVKDSVSFIESEEKPGDEAWPFEECEDKLIARFGLHPEDIDTVCLHSQYSPFER